MYVLIHLGNINNSEREYKGREKKKTPNSVTFRIFKKILLIHERQTERGRDTGRERSRLLTGSPMRDRAPNPGIMP